MRLLGSEILSTYSAPTSHMPLNEHVERLDWRYHA